MGSVGVDEIDCEIASGIFKLFGIWFHWHNQKFGQDMKNYGIKFF